MANREKSRVLVRTGGHTLIEVQQGLWQLEFFFPAPTNCWLILQPDGLCLIDAGHPWNARAILDAVIRIGQPLKHVLITHAHPDHAGAAAAVAAATGAAIYAHDQDIAYLNGSACLADADGSLLCRAVLAAGKHLRILHSPRIDRLNSISDAAVIDGLTVFHTPGHTPGSISLWSEQARAIFCGDNVCASRGMLHLGLPWFTLDRPTQRSSVRKYADVPARLLLSGHGPVYRGDVPAAISLLLGSLNQER